ncbi:hypothetical protein QQS21_009959 [Conoideocrella luteorostrata]|uniref:Uncharacterized protein n=1 Tax=Conoideocrella luteorostrata TaxID=1105319 RepID=A0AAJ0CFY4_9HYPO|nr:hypothetical protein QQS21_009959 [Conoideocrella luteorostrata]
MKQFSLVLVAALASFAAASPLRRTGASGNHVVGRANGGKAGNIENSAAKLGATIANGATGNKNGLDIAESALELAKSITGRDEDVEDE